MKITRTYKYRIYPNKSQQAILDEWMVQCLRLWNMLLWHSKNAENPETDSIKKYADETWLQFRAICYSLIRQTDEDIANVPTRITNYVLRRLDKTFQLAAKGERGFPNFKGSSNPINSIQAYFGQDFTLSNVDVVRAAAKDPENRVRGTILELRDAERIVHLNAFVTRINDPIQVRYHRSIPETATRIGSAQIIKEAYKWYVALGVEFEIETNDIHGGRAIGIDLGLVNALVLSNGETYHPDSLYSDILKELRRIQRHENRQRRANNPDCFDNKGRSIKGKRQDKVSKRRKRTLQRIQKLHQRLVDARNIWIHTIADRLTKNYGLICLEDISPQFMIANKHLALKRLDVPWGKMVATIKDKAQVTGTTIIEVDPKFTSQTCSECGHTDKANRLSQAIFRCKVCSNELNADHNAAINILNKGLAQ